MLLVEQLMPSKPLLDFLFCKIKHDLSNHEGIYFEKGVWGNHDNIARVNLNIM